MPRNATRLENARLLRDALLPLIQRQGAIESVGEKTPIKPKIVDIQGWKFSLMTPFNPMPKSSLSVFDYHKAVILQKKGDQLPYLLDIWRTTKLASIEWSGADLRIISFQPGQWHEELLSFIAEESQAHPPAVSETTA